MKSLFKKVRDVAIAGFFAVFPIYVLFLVLSKAWTHLTVLGAKISGMFGMKSFLGIHGSTALTGLLVIGIWIVSGLLVRISFMTALSRAMEVALSKYLPGYATYKEIAEEKLQHKVKLLPYTTALIKWQEYWQPAYIVEQDQDGNCVVFLPDTPETKTGRLLLTRRDRVRIVPSITANQLDASLKETGRGLLSQYSIMNDGISKT